MRKKYPHKTKTDFLTVKKGETRSRFVVDLKEKLSHGEEDAATGNPFFRPVREAAEFYEAHKENVRSLAIAGVFFSLIKGARFAWRLFYRLCYRIGWTAVFSVRFLQILTTRFSGPVPGLIISAGKSYDSLRIKDRFLGFGNSFLSHFRNYRAGLLLDRARKLSLEQHRIAAGPESEVLKYGIFRQTALFTLALVIMVLPLKALTSYKAFDIEGLKGRVLGASEKAIGDFLSASDSASSLDFNRAKEDFSQAGANFVKAQSELDDINVLLFALASIAPDKKLRMASEARQIVSAGKAAADLGANLSAAFESMIGKENGDRKLKEMLDDFIRYGTLAVIDASRLSADLSGINPYNLPDEYRLKFSYSLDKAQVLEKSLSEFVGLAGRLKNFLGSAEDKRYLLTFQNNAELRASGGFIGSFAVIDFRDAKIKNLETPGGGSYDTEAGLKEMVAAPEPLQLVNPLWHFWDANWWPDWPTSAKKLEWFYERSDGSTVDGVISLTPTVLEKVLEVIGPVDMKEKYGVVIDADNFWLTTQRFAERKQDVTREPKKIIGDLMTEIIEVLPGRLDQKTVIGLLRAMEESLDGKQILFYFHDKELQSQVSRYGWDGSIKNASSDYLSVINTNIAGGKSDRVMEESIKHTAEIGEDGSIVDTVTIERAHTGAKNAEFVGVRNVDWMRIYVPKGAKLIEASGFRIPDKGYFSYPEAGWKDDPDIVRTEMMARIHEETGTKIYEENGHTVFANWSMTDPGETSVIYLKYSLPWKFEPKSGRETFLERMKASLGWKDQDIYYYSLLVQKQSGSRPSGFESEVSIKGDLETFWKYPESLAVNGGWQVSDSIDRDKFYGAMFKEKNIRY